VTAGGGDHQHERGHERPHHRPPADQRSQATGGEHRQHPPRAGADRLPPHGPPLERLDADLPVDVVHAERPCLPDEEHHRQAAQVVGHVLEAPAPVEGGGLGLVWSLRSKPPKHS
jgi:hypothetical protein